MFENDILRNSVNFFLRIFYWRNRYNFDNRIVNLKKRALFCYCVTKNTSSTLINWFCWTRYFVNKDEVKYNTFWNICSPDFYVLRFSPYICLRLYGKFIEHIMFCSSFFVVTLVRFKRFANSLDISWFMFWLTSCLC